MKTRIYITILGLFVGLVSCEDVLDKQPTDVVAETNFWVTEADAEAGLVACYDAMRIPEDRSAFSWERWGSFDLMCQVGVHRNGGLRAISTSTQNATWRDFERAWRGHYRGFVRTNDFLTNVERIPFTDDDRKDHAIGEARFLRALYSYALTMIWKDVPYFENVPTLEDIGPDKTPQAEIIAAIKADLNDAIALLPDTPDEIGRAGKGAAYMLRLKLALFEEDWGAAVTAAEDVMNLGIYSLEPNYSDVFTIENENNPEVIFDVQAIADSDIEPGNTIEDMYSGRFASNSGLSWVGPSLWLVDKYEVIDPTPDYTQEDERIPTEIYDYFEGRDPRMDASIIRPGARFIGIGSTDFLYPFVQNYTHSRSGLHSRKYVIPGDGSRDGSGASPLNFIIFRYADAILHYAEARAQQNPGGGISDPLIIDALNQIRSRASDQLPLYTTSSFSSIDELLNAIYDERIREMALEGWLYWDFKRWGLIEQRNGFESMGMFIDNDVVAFDPNPKVIMAWTPNKDEYFPIPQAEIDLTGMEQNPGW